MTLPAGTRLGPHELLAPLGAGGMGEVYRARDTRLGREVAIKLLPAAFSADPDRLRRFDEEARAASALNHPNILTIHDIGSQDGAPYVVSELLEGETLRDRLAAGPLPQRKAVACAIQFAQGLAAAHEKGIIHRDLKPENLFVTKDGRVKILDFGLAKLTRPEAKAAAASHIETAAGTEPGVILGTVGYMSPEQVRGKAADQRSDIFSFGAVLYEMLSGQRAFQGDSPIETMNAILRDDPPDLSPAIRDLPPALDRIVRRCLEKNSEERFQVARDVAFVLEAFSGVSSRPSAPPFKEEPGERRKSVAILPFKDLARDPENAHLGLGLADATITELALVKSLVVRPTAAVLRYQGETVNPQEAGRELGVDAVADGSFQRSGSRLRVTVQLIATAGGKPLWGTKIDASLEDVFRMQDEVSRRIAEALQVELTPADERRMARTARSSGAAYELYARGRLHLAVRETLVDTNAAIEWFEKATQLDPDFPLAWAGLSDAYSRMAFSFDPEGGWFARAEETCRKALELDGRLPEGRYLQARMLWSPQRGFDHAGAIRELVAAITGRPNLYEAEEWLCIVLCHVAMLEPAIQAARRALAINPEDVRARLHLGLCHFLSGRHREALEVTAETQEPLPSPWGLYQLAQAQLRLGRTDEATRTVERALRHFPGDVLFHPIRGILASIRGEEARAREQVQLTIQNKRSFGHYHHAQYDIACIHALLGEKEEALRWLSDSARNGFPCHTFFETDPFLEAARGEEPFRRLMDELATECEGYRQLYARLQADSGPESVTSSPASR